MNDSKATARALEYPCGNRPDAGTAREIAPGILWLSMPVPSSLAFINLWALRDGEAWTLVDTGLHDEATVGAWTRLLGPGGPLGDAPVSRIIVTHMHADHTGMAGWLAQRFGCRLWMTRDEYLTCRVLRGDTGRPAPDAAIGFYRRCGWDDEAIRNYRERFGQFGRMIHSLPDSYRRMHNGEWIRIGANDWRVVVGRGHSPEHACLHAPALRLMISGDQVLPRISPNVSVHPTEPDANPLAEWLSSIELMRREVPDDVLVLPAHNEPFRGLHARLDHLARGHEQGLARLAQILEEPRRVVDTFPALFSRRIVSPMDLLLATGESLAHLNYLLAAERIEAVEDDRGVAWYRAYPSAPE